MSRFCHVPMRRGLLSALVLLFYGLIGHVPMAQAGVSTAGSINPLPSATLLHIGDTIDVDIRITNTSQTTPPDAFQFLPATLTAGTVVTFEACADAACTVPLLGTLVFVPVGGTGCVTNVANVTSCAPDNPVPALQSQVLITVSGTGVPLPALTDTPNFVDIATVRLMATTPVGTPGGAFFLRVATGDNQITATFGATTATGGASGSTGMNFPPPTLTPTNTPTDTPTNTPTETPTNTPTEAPTNTPTNSPTATPTNTPPLVQACSPGYWKNHTGPGKWPAPYTPNTLFVTAFGVNAFPGKTLLGVLQTGGGGLTALGRQIVNALLNSAKLPAYPLTTAQVIAAFQAAFASGNYDTLLNQLESFGDNCPLN